MTEADVFNHVPEPAPDVYNEADVLLPATKVSAAADIAEA